MLLEGRKGIQECLDGGMKVARKFGKIEIFWLAWFAHAGVFRICKRFARKRKALRVIPRGKQWLTVYRAHQVPESKNKGKRRASEQNTSESINTRNLSHWYFFPRG